MDAGAGLRIADDRRGVRAPIELTAAGLNLALSNPLSAPTVMR
jgi:hypothetical protein